LPKWRRKKPGFWYAKQATAYRAASGHRVVIIRHLSAVEQGLNLLFEGVVAMPRVYIIAGMWVVLLVTLLPVSVAQEAEDEAVSLFDGESFDGWEGNLEMFRIRDGAIVGGTLEGRVPRNEFLCTTREYEDFELRLQCKLLGQGANAGIQIRSKRIPDHHEMIGYQADMGDGWWGCIYDESRRRKMLTRPPRELRAKIIRRDDWNEYVIRCQGKRIQLWINGTQTADYTEPDPSIPQRGVIGLQIHGGPPSEAWYKDIRVKELGTE